MPWLLSCGCTSPGIQRTHSCRIEQLVAGTNPTRNRIEQRALSATVVSIEEGVARARLEGSLRMKHNFYPGREDDNFVDATLAGYLDFDTGKHGLRRLRLVTGDARYARFDFGVAVRSAE